MTTEFQHQAGYAASPESLREASTISLVSKASSDQDAIYRDALHIVTGLAESFAARKNIPLLSGDYVAIARDALSRLDFATLRAFLVADGEAATCAAHALNRTLDVFALCRIGYAVFAIDNKPAPNDAMLVRAAESALDAVKANDRVANVMVWPDVLDTARAYFAARASLRQHSVAISHAGNPARLAVSLVDSLMMTKPANAGIFSQSGTAENADG